MQMMRKRQQRLHCGSDDIIVLIVLAPLVRRTLGERRRRSHPYKAEEERRRSQTQIVGFNGLGPPKHGEKETTKQASYSGVLFVAPHRRHPHASLTLGRGKREKGSEFIFINSCHFARTLLIESYKHACVRPQAVSDLYNLRREQLAIATKIRDGVGPRQRAHLLKQLRSMDAKKAKLKKM